MTITKTDTKTGSRPARLPEVLTKDEQERLLSQPNQNAATGMRNFCLLVLYLNLGLRVREALNLKIDDIDWNAGMIKVVAGKGNRDRVLWLSEIDLEALKKWRVMRKVKNDYLFCTLNNGRLDDRYVRAFVARYARKAEINKRVHPHTLRHTFATDLLSTTKNIRLVQKALGHVSISTTMIYTHIVDDELENALKNFRG